MTALALVKCRALLKHVNEALVVSQRNVLYAGKGPSHEFHTRCSYCPTVYFMCYVYVNISCLGNTYSLLLSMEFGILFGNSETSCGCYVTDQFGFLIIAFVLLESRGVRSPRKEP